MRGIVCKNAEYGNRARRRYPMTVGALVMWLAIVLVDEEFGRHRIKLKPKLERLHPRRVLAMIRHLDMALIVAIDLSEKSKAPEYGLINRTVWRALLSVGAVGDVCGHYLDAEAHVIDHELAACVVNPPTKDPGKVRSGFPKRSCSNKELTRDGDLT
ncbi:sugar-binding domain-containing protein [Bradyrhizobium macuxiense]|uniref:sugar-binding domain-containing protein n=1 Tax=Bradyrhizobium macuxiense TaxID=1755647 RepID=UPI001FDA67DA|nr:sugar-binding domain-containing protein [Bradyrhizobium macuxiense]